MTKEHEEGERMTPLAYHIISRQTLPVAKRPIFKSHDKFLENMCDIHCFETTEIEPLRFDLTNQIARMRKEGNVEEIQKLVFLPAPRTWLEREQSGDRFGYLLVEWPTKLGFDLYAGFKTGGGLIGKAWFDNPFGIEPDKPLTYRDLDPETGHAYPAQHLGDAVAQLVLINSPHIIGRRQHMPSRILEKKLAARLGVGKFPLHAWTEIKLHVAKPVEIDDGEEHEAHLTGRRALHFCRQHIRIRLGRLEYVRAHWRGDPAIGIKRSRYLVTA